MKRKSAARWRPRTKLQLVDELPPYGGPFPLNYRAVSYEHGDGTQTWLTPKELALHVALHEKTVRRHLACRGQFFGVRKKANGRLLIPSCYANPATWKATINLRAPAPARRKRPLTAAQQERFNEAALLWAAGWKASAIAARLGYADGACIRWFKFARPAEWRTAVQRAKRSALIQCAPYRPGPYEQRRPKEDVSLPQPWGLLPASAMPELDFTGRPNSEAVYCFNLMTTLFDRGLTGKTAYGYWVERFFRALAEADSVVREHFLGLLTAMELPTQGWMITGQPARSSDHA